MSGGEHLKVTWKKKKKRFCRLPTYQKIFCTFKSVRSMKEKSRAWGYRFKLYVNTLIYTDLKWRLIEVALVLQSSESGVSLQRNVTFSVYYIYIIEYRVFLMHPVNLTLRFSWNSDSLLYYFVILFPLLQFVSLSFFPHNLLSYSLSSLPIDF